MRRPDAIAPDPDVFIDLSLSKGYSRRHSIGLIPGGVRWGKERGRGKPNVKTAGGRGLRRFFVFYQRACPSLPVQRRIAEILSTLDEAIEQTEALIAKMQQVKAGLMHDLFTRGVTPDGRLRPTREQAQELYKESPIGWIPRE